MELTGNLVNVVTKEIYPARVLFEQGLITEVEEIEALPQGNDQYLLPGLIDSHIHIESSMLCPSRFAEIVVPNGTTAVVADPHEIANVLGLRGIEYMRWDASGVPLRVFFTAPSCVPATPFETSGARLDHLALSGLLGNDDVVALGEMMDYPGVVRGIPKIMAKIEAAKRVGKPIDGHAPLLTGRDLCKYVAAGISTDHECITAQEALEKARLGVKIMLREGSAAKNLEDLITINEWVECFIVTDDRHLQDLLEGHLTTILQKAIQCGLDPVEAVRMVTFNPAEHYGLNAGAIVPNRWADIVVVRDLKSFYVEKVFINGELVAKSGKPLFTIDPQSLASTIAIEPPRPEKFLIRPRDPDMVEGRVNVRVIEAENSQIFTKAKTAELTVRNGRVQIDPAQDILKLSVVERYGLGNIGLAFIKGFGLKNGALATSVAHDSHNIITVGLTEEDMVLAVRTVAEMGGGLVVVENGSKSKSSRIITKLPLPIAGLMSCQSAVNVENQLINLQAHAKKLGCTLDAPFMTLSFLALLVIPELKLSDRGLFDVTRFSFVDLFVD